jgi:O-antigen/teichoic acid export membrane protein
MYVGLVSMVITTVVGIWMSRFLLQHVGQHDYGVWLVLGQNLGYLDILDLGVVGLLGREVSAAMGRAGGVEQATDMPVLVGRTVRLLAYQMPLVGLVAFSAIVFLPADWAGVRGPVLAILVTYVAFFPMRIPHAVLDGLQALRDVGIMQFLSWATSTVVSIVLILRGWHLGALAAGYFGAQLVRSVTYLVRLFRRYPTVIPRSLVKVPFAEVVDLMKRGAWLTMQRLGGMFLSASDKIIVNYFLGTSLVVPFSCTSRAYDALENVPRMLLDLARPGLTEARSGAARDQIVRVCGAMTLGTLIFTGFFATVVFAVNEGFVTWWIGSEQWGGHRLSLTLATAMVFRVWLTSLIYTAFAFGLDQRLTVTLILDGAVTVVASAALTKTLGYMAIPLGQIIGGLVVSVPMILGAVAKDIGVSPWAFVKPLAPWAWRFVACMTGSYFFARAYTPVTFVKLIVSSTGASLLYWVVMLPCAMESSLGPYIRRALRLPAKASAEGT